MKSVPRKAENPPATWRAKGSHLELAGQEDQSPGELVPKSVCSKGVFKFGFGVASQLLENYFEETPKLKKGWLARVRELAVGQPDSDPPAPASQASTAPTPMLHLEGVCSLLSLSLKFQSEKTWSNFIAKGHSRCYFLFLLMLTLKYISKDEDRICFYFF